MDNSGLALPPPHGWEGFEAAMPKLNQGLDAKGVYKKLEPVSPLRRRP